MAGDHFGQEALNIAWVWYVINKNEFMTMAASSSVVWKYNWNVAWRDYILQIILS